MNFQFKCPKTAMSPSQKEHFEGFALLIWKWREQMFSRGTLVHKLCPSWSDKFIIWEEFGLASTWTTAVSYQAQSTFHTAALTCLLRAGFIWVQISQKWKLQPFSPCSSLRGAQATAGHSGGCSGCLWVFTNLKSVKCYFHYCTRLSDGIKIHIYFKTLTVFYLT